MAVDTYATGADWGADWNPSVPVDGDSAFVPETLATSITGTMDQGLIDLALLYTHPGFLYDVGASGSPLLIAAIQVIIKAAGNFYIASDAGGAATDINDIRIMAAHRDAIIEIDSNAADPGEIDGITALRGNILIKGNTLFEAAAVLNIGWMTERSRDVRLNLATGADTLPALRMRGGVVATNRAITLADVYAGELTHDLATLATLNLYGGKVVYNHSALTVATVYPGAELDLMQTSEQKEITTLNRYPGSIVHLDGSIHTVPTTNWL